MLLSPTGFQDLDSLLGAPTPQLILISGETSVGKTSFVRNVANSAARRGVGLGFIITTEDAEDTRRLMIQAASPLADPPNYHRNFTLSGATTVARLLRDIRALKAQCPDVGVVILDDINCLASDIRVPPHQIAHALRDVTRELGIVALVICRLKRAVRDGDDHVPEIQDLRDPVLAASGDSIVFLWREDDRYVPDANIVHFRVARHPSGCLGSTRLGFIGRSMTFLSLR